MLTVHKVLNNNVILCADEHGQEYVATGRGIAFLLPVGGVVDPSKVHRLFVSTDSEHGVRLASRIAALPPADVELAIVVAEAAGGEFGSHIVDRLVVPLADHLGAALQRQRAGIGIDYPLQWETRAFHPRQVEFGRRAVDIVEEQTGERLPDIEAIPIALHVVNAELGTDSVMDTMDMTGTVASCIALVRGELGLDGASSDHATARFASHLIHLLARQRTGRRPVDELAPFLVPFAAEHPREYACARNVAAEISRAGEPDIDEEEVLLLTLHIVRLALDAKNG